MNDKNVFYKLTSREQDIARLMVNGLSTREISEELILAYSTVRSYLRDLYSKLHVHGFDEAVDKIESLGLLQDEPSSIINRKHNLATLSNQLIGRQTELETLSHLLTKSTTQLITLLGPGGIGKTRLALEVGTLIWQQFTDGTFFVNLQSQQTDKDVLNAIIDTLPIQNQPNNQQTQLETYLSQRHMLLILDNFEQIMSGTEVVTSLLTAAPQLRILITSRKALNVIDEHICPLIGLPFSYQEQDSNALDYPSVQLFVERALRVRPSFSVDDEIDGILQICRTVEGLPLALEIAASWTKVAICENIATEIQNGIDFLASRFNDISPRHRSMRVVFDHSWSMLTLHEKDILPRLSVFKDGFTQEAAHWVAGATWADLASLVEKSLIQMDILGRYNIHELLRQYSEENLNDKQADTLVAHCTFFTNFMAEREADIKGQRQLSALDEIEADFENVRVAWLYAIEEQDTVALEAMLECLYWFSNFRVRVPQSLEMLRQALESVDAEQHPLLWVRLRSRFTRLSTEFWSQPANRRANHLAALRTLLEPCWEILQHHNSPADMAFCELLRGKIEQDGVRADVDNQHPDGYQLAAQSMKHSIRLYAELDDSFYLGLAKYKVAWLYLLYARRDKAQSAIHESLEICQEIGDIIGAGRALSFIVDFDTTAMGQYDLALQQAREIQQIAEKNGDLFTINYNGHILCDILFKLGRFSEGKLLAQRLLPFAQDLNDKLQHAFFLQQISLINSMSEDYTNALGFANASHALIGDTVNWEQMIIHRPLAAIACGQEDYVALKQHLTVLLTLACSDTKGQPGYLIEYLPLALFWLTHEGQVEYATSIIGMMASHSAESTIRWAAKWPAYQRLYQSLEDELETEKFQSVYRQGANLNLREVVETILDSLTIS